MQTQTKLNWPASAVGVVFSMIGCVSSAPQDCGISFTRFPANFTATQIIRVKPLQGKESERSLIASLQRDQDDWKLTFLDPVMQIPLLYLSYVKGRETIETLVDVAAGQINSAQLSQLFAAIRKLYGSNRFVCGSEPGTLWSTGGEPRFVLGDFSGNLSCLFPGSIEAKIAHFRILVKMEEWQCRG